ncbi:Tyrosine-protein phosphatase non-receptor type 23 [Halocaridina rubra]|uniref:Tyrosine-protein phosphatase non-receptor type 23 n=1 Tax=Halocaridina rubra TaxID=373956 RepID=A0AAN8ZUT9_HALRR
MEAVPRLPMLSFDLKPSAESVEFGPKLRQYIRDHYNEDPDNYSTEIHELEGLRAGAIHAPRDFTGCSTLKRYYCQLHFLLSRFPLSENSSLAITFNWYDIYSSISYSVTDIKYEMACILYNIGALHTDLGAMDARNTPDGMKISCTHFQCAAWAFQHLRDTYPQPRESDMNPTLLTFLYNVSLAQAQECILEKSMTDNRKPTIIAKVAMQVVEYLKTAMKNLGSAKGSDAVITEIVGSKKLKVWRRYCDFKISYYGAVALLYQGMQAEEQQKMGERLAYYQAAVDMLNESSKLAKNLEKQELTGESLTFSNDVMSGKLTAAQKENEFVYHEKVPPLSSLAEVKGASLVKGIPFSVNDPEVSGQDIFIKLVPIEAHQHSSMYSEEKAKLLRHICGEIQEKNEELETYLASMQLDPMALDSNSETLPQELVESCADLNASNGVRKLTEIMAKISSFYHDINAALGDIHRSIEEEEEKEKEFLTMMGKRAPNMILAEMKREASKYRDAHQSAQDNNTALHRAITTHLSNLTLLSKPLDQVVEAMPSVAEVEAQGDVAAKQEVKRLLGKVREMQTQRAKWEDQLRKDLHEDDVTKQLVTNQEDMEEFFKNELKKHDKLVVPLQQNMSAQNNILQALSEANAAYATTRRMTNQVQAQRTEMINTLLASYDAYLNILKKAEDAQEFYHKLEGQVNKLTARVKSVLRVQDEEREEVLSANVKKFTGSGKVPGAPVLSSQPTVADTMSSSTVSGPKLKDFLQHMKGGGGGSLPSGSLPSAGMVGYGYNDPNAPYTSSVRPSPLGSEQSDMTSSAGVPASAYTASYSSQASAYRPSAPSPAPSPAPQTSSGSPYKTSSTNPSASSGHYYSPQQINVASYSSNAVASGGSSTSGYATPTTFSTAATAINSTATSQASAHSASQYGYNSQYPSYGYHTAGGPSSHTTSTLSSNNNTQLRLPISPPGHNVGNQGQQTQYQQQYGYGTTLATGKETNSLVPSATPQRAFSGDARNSTQGYYGYYPQQQPGTVQTPSTMPVTAAASLPASTLAVSPQQTYPAPATAATTHSSFQYPYQYPQSQATSTSTAGAMYSQAGRNRVGHNTQTGGLAYSNQTEYGSSYYSAQTGTANTQSVFPNQGTPAGYSGSYHNQPQGTSGVIYTSQPPTTISQSAGVMTPKASSTYPSDSTTPSQWNIYSGYPQGGISSYTSSQAGTSGTTTIQMMGGSEGTNMQQCPYSCASVSTTTNTQSIAGTTQMPSHTGYPANSAQSSMQYNQGVQYNQSYTTHQWAQYGTPQSYQHQQQQSQQQKPLQSQQQTSLQPQPQTFLQPQQQTSHQPQQQTSLQPQQQTPLQPQQQTSLQPQQQTPLQPQKQTPLQPQQQTPLQPQQQTPLQPQQHQPPAQQLPLSQHQAVQPQQSTAHAKAVAPESSATVPSVTTGISNLDLLSGIELTSPSGSQWSPLTPQPAAGGNIQIVESASGNAVETATIASRQSTTAPDVTSGLVAATSSKIPPALGSTLPNVVSSVSLLE